MPSDLKYIPLNLIDGPDHAMRGDLNEEALHDLVESIRQVGIITPLSLRARGERYEVIAGARRRMAAIYAGLSEVPCVVRLTDDSEATVIKMHENLVREDVDPVAEGRFISEAIAQLGLGVAEFAERINRSVPYIEARLTIHRMPDYMKEGIKTGRLGIGVALELVKVDDDAQRARWVEDAIRNGMTLSTAKYAVAVYESQRENNPQGDGTTQMPLPPIELPVLLWVCARCGQQAQAQDMEMVRVHKADCPEPTPAPEASPSS